MEKKLNGRYPIFKYGVLAILSFVLFSMVCFANLETTLETPKRYISCMPSITEILYGLGLEEQIVGVTTACNFPPEAAKKEKVGGVTMNLERIIALKPDLVFLLEDAQKRDIEKMKKFKLPLFVINPHSVDDVKQSVLDLGKVTGQEKVAEYMVKTMNDRIAKVERKIRGKEKKKVFLIVGHRPLTTVGRNNFINDIIDLAGGINLGGTSRSPYPQFSFEQLVKYDPEALIILEGVISKRELENDSRFKSLSAMRNNMVLFINPDLLCRPTPRLVGAIEEIALFLHNEK
ncbi:hypothetical protein A2276_00145 [candidate division WOR-1 bacterium RIFOXYA12_FULL_43_27]|uniref:Fe/B12 periplasmic-binding domain-containing protein n=1 Tax=candidate division WOR-1 bacterium RIFOXYC2_FULL_46_14 TaxID=1802587 RepID=A0A1F4U4B1_UNCSA|nr:MAG: hypothetical protein A2276_00145 [candidate division WOR-1 bacterium RIFOXYA12_FULL_43_27]OGC20892.1 MAG: hypothetical protein A2292_07730 [candidate division WOR-1 bacterium RIFOXYB2_FULL_46_45]OGC31370.1 MAG: hypothetical protein A2232_03715 [candidate division WOR-1 bacterium RIFOXYA2_FULL_46_56]OGC39776.1 MAG: hypothetical protein A2438_04550 [candidate division WOR-1 bacterium RIFOXYC2_FULL_46_14]